VNSPYDFTISITEGYNLLEIRTDEINKKEHADLNFVG
jgi:hypothetical protein